MKYGVIGFSCLREDRMFVNIGDWFQSIAILEQYKKMDIKEEDVIIIDINELNNYNGEYVILPININLSHNWIIDILPLPPKIIPVFIGLSYFSATKLSDKLIEYFREFSPVGCRDESTLKLMRQYGISSYLYGCITLTLPTREENHADKIYCVDMPDVLSDYFPKEIRNSEIINISHIYKDDKAINSYHSAIELLSQYATDAKLVITSRMHSIAPCLGMGIPVIAAVENCSPRFGGLDKFINIYTPETFENINWTPDIVNLDQAKKIMEEHFRRTVRKYEDKYKTILDFSYYLETREKSNYGSHYKSSLKKIPFGKDDSFEYAIWGTGQVGIGVYEAMKEHYPKSQMVMAIDSFCKGEFFGLEINQPYKLLENKDAYILIASYSGEKEIVNYLKNNNYVEFDHYLKLGTTTG